jgi:glycosyltransferase involved in cell wall biosynthesis
MLGCHGGRLDGRGDLSAIAIVAASELTVKAFLPNHLAALAQRYRVCVIVNTANAQLLDKLGIAAELIAAPIARPIAPIADLRALAQLTRLFRRRHFDVVHSFTPKAGLIAMLAGRMAGVPRRLHTFTGQVWANRRGPMRGVLKTADRLIANSATHVLADSRSQRDFLVAQGIVHAGKASVLGRGSISGVDPDRFHPDAAKRGQVRAALGIPEAATVFLYLGRLKRDKGVLDLARAFALCSDSQARLLLVGPDEDGLEQQIRGLAGTSAARVHCVPYTDRPQEYFAAADIFCLPSYREGFGTTIVEAAAAGVPAIGSRIYGITDAIVEGETGLLFEAGNVQQLARSMHTLAGDKTLRGCMGEEAMKRAVRDFSSAIVTAALLQYYEQLLAQPAG